MKSESHPFRPRARLLLQLGNQLIRDESIALFELVKNSYDADAKVVIVQMNKIDTPDGEIIIKDDGCGMDWEIITDVWLEPGTDFREKQIARGQRTPKYNRIPLGKKGIGRFGAHKLGRNIFLITRKAKNNEIVVKIDWEDFEKKKYLDDVNVNISERKPELFTGEKTGTCIVIKNFWQSWNRGMIRDIYRSLNSICSPFDSPDSFKTKLVLLDKDKEKWLEGLISWKEALNYKLFNTTCYLKNDELIYVYEFKPWPSMTLVEGRKVDRLNNPPMKMTYEDPITKQKIPIDLGKCKIGDVKIDINIYDLDTAILSLEVTDKKGLKEFLKFNGGLRVYRDGVRVYDYGEPGNDWLDLGTRRVNIPTKRLSNNIILGAVLLKSEQSTDLIEKTNREGFIENEATKIFRNAILFALTQIEAERNKDKERIRIAYKMTSHKEPVLDDISELREKIEKKGLTDELGGYLNRIESDFKDIQDKLLTSAGAGLSLSIVIHEINKIIEELKLAVDKEKGISRIKELTKHLADLTEGYAALVRREGKVKIKASELIAQAIFNVEYRLAAHNIELINGCNKENDFELKCVKRLILGGIMNILDNSIWWLENKKPAKKFIFISTTRDLKGGPAIVIGDNGPGFIDEMEYITQPFFTRKPDGMGLGLHITNEIMKIHKGKLILPEKGDIQIPNKIDGAIIAMQFRGESNESL